MQIVCRRAVRRGASFCVLMFALTSAALIIGHSRASAADPSKATTSRAAQQHAKRLIPTNRLSAEDRAKVNYVLAKPSIFRRLPVQVIDCDPALYLFMIRNPQVLTNIWGVMGISRMAIRQIAPGQFQASDGAGTMANIKNLFSSDNTHLFYAEGIYDGPLFSQPVRTKCVLLLKSGYVRETNGRYYVTSRLDAFIRVEHFGAALLAKTLHPWLGKNADSNFLETTTFIGSVSRTAEVNPMGFKRLVAKLTKIDPAVRRQFAEMALGIAKRGEQVHGMPAAARQQANSSPQRIMAHWKH